MARRPRTEAKRAKVPKKVMNPRSTNEAHVALGQKIRAARLKKNWSQADLGEVLGVTFQQIQKYERGRNRIDFSRLMDIARHLNVDVEYFVGAVERTRNGEAANEFDAVLASPRGVQIVEAMIELNAKQQQLVIDFARRLPGLVA